MRKIAAVLIYLALTGNTAIAEDAWQYYMNGNSLFNIAAQGDNIWCATQSGIVRWNARDSTYTQYTPLDGFPLKNPALIAPDKTGGIWISDSYAERGAAHYDGVFWKKYDSANSGLPSSRITALLPDSKGNVWFGSLDAGIVRFDGSEWKTFLPDDLLNAIPEGVTVDRSGVKWLIFGSGVCAFDGVNYRVYKKEDGLAGNSVRRITPGPDGSLWFCTSSGVSRYDGASWKTWSVLDGLVNRAVSAIAFAPDGAIWFSTDGGVSRFDGDSWKSFTERDNLMSNKTSGIAIDRTGKIWVCHPNQDNGVSCYDSSQWKWYATWNSGIAGNRVYDVVTDREGVVWFATDGGISSYNGAEWKSWTTREGLVSNRVSGISIDSRNRKWILYDAESQAGVSCFDGVAFTTLTERDGLRSNVVWSAAAEGDTLWFCTGRGLCSFDGSSWEQYPDRNRLISKNIRDIAEDRNGALWFATEGGLSRLDDSGWKTFTDEDGLPANMVTAVAAGPDGRIWMVADSTVVEFDGESFRSHPLEMGAVTKNVRNTLSHLSVDNRSRVWTNVISMGTDGSDTDIPRYALFRLDGDRWEIYPVEIGPAYYSGQKGFLVMNDGETVWVSTRDGLLRCTPRSQSLYQFNCPANSYAWNMAVDSGNVKWFLGGTDLISFDDTTWKSFTWSSHLGEDIAIDRNDKKWFWNEGTDTFISFDGEAWNTFAAPEDCIPPNSSARYFVLDHAGNKWLTYDSGGVVSFDGESWTRYATRNGLASDQIHGLAVDTEDRKWFATSGGVSVFDGISWKTYTTSDGLASNSVLSVAVDDNDVKWFGTAEGITRFDGEVWKTYTTSDGLPGNRINIITAGTAGILWAATDKGIARFDGIRWKSFAVHPTGVLGTKQFVADHFNTLWTFTSNQLVSVDRDSIRYHGEAYSLFVGVDRNNIKWLSSMGGTWSCLASLDDRAKPATGETPRALITHHNYPNPFNARTNISFDLYTYGKVDIVIYNLLGQKVRALLSGILDAGSHSVPWDGTDSGGRNLSSGVYFYRIATQGQVAGKKMLLLK